MQFNLRHRLSVWLVRTAVLYACGIAIVLGFAQLLLDAREQSRELNSTLTQILLMQETSALLAVNTQDPLLVQNVVDSLAEYPSIYDIELLALPGTQLSHFERMRPSARLRILSDFIFGPERRYFLTLRDAPNTPPVGVLQIMVDTYTAGGAFLRRARTTVIAGVIGALLLTVILLAVFSVSLGRPLQQLLAAFDTLSPQTPEKFRLPALKRERREDELDAWVTQSNQVFQTLEENLAKREVAEARANYLLQFDELTDLPGRNLFYDRVDQAMQRARQENYRVAMLCFDIRDFHAVNDQYGLSVGDHLLKAIAQRLVRVVAERGTVARFGGNEFGVLAYRLDTVEDAADLAQDIINAFRKPFEVDGHIIHLSSCIGISVFPDDAEQVSQLSHNGENALGLAKNSGLDRYHFYIAELGTQIRSRKALEQELEHAIANDELEIFYHPQFCAHSNVVVGAEALLRWKHPQRGWLLPDSFIPLAEETGLILPLGEWTIRQACRHARAWQADGLVPLRVAVNISAQQLRNQNLIRILREQLMETRLPPELLELEITETAIMEDIHYATELLTKIRASGVQLSMDDFGTGYSSLSYLKHLPINRLKIDRSFITDLLADPNDAMIVKSVIELGHGLGFTVMAEGVETNEQAECLREYSCDEVQGYYFTPPLPEAAFRRYIKER